MPEDPPPREPGTALDPAPADTVSSSLDRLGAGGAATELRDGPSGASTRYRVLEEVGRGGMATVYRATDTALGREVALKVLHPHLADDPESRLRLQREAQAVARLRHDNILEIHDYSGADSSQSYLVTEFIRGQTLTAFLARSSAGPSLPEPAVMITQQLASALEEAHRHGIIHRDIKPENVMIRDDGRVKLMDFGIAQVVDRERLTATGQLIGSPAYLAPELVEGGPVDFRTDVFALGIVLYRLATGALPFQGRNPHEVMKRIVEARPAPPDQLNPLIGTQLARIIGRCLQARPADRYPDMGALRRDLEENLEAAGIDSPRAELVRYFADPAGWERTARPRLVAALVSHAKAEAARGRSAAATQLAARALAIDPGDGAARALLGRVTRRRQLGLAAAGVAVVALAGGGGWLAWREHRPEQPDRRAAKEAARVKSRPTKPTAEEPPRTASPSADDEEGARARLAPHPARPRRPPPADPTSSPTPAVVAAAPRQIAVNVIPKNVEVVLDGKSLGAWLPGAPIEVPPGAHTVEFRSPYCLPSHPVSIGPDDTRVPEVRLAWRPASLTVHATPPDADVVLELHGKKQALRRVEQLPIPIPAGSAVPYEHVRITVSADGYRDQVIDDLRLTAGELTEREIALAPSTR